MESPKKKKVLEKFATKLSECTLRVDVKIGKTYKIEVTDDGFTVRKRRQKSEDGMHFRYENVTSYQATKEGDQFVLQIDPTSLGSAGGLFRFKTSEAAKIVALASRLSVVAAVRKEAQLNRTVSGGSLPSSPKAPIKTPAYHSGPLPTASQSLSPSEQSNTSESVLSSSPDSGTSKTNPPTKGGGSQELLRANVAPPKWTTTPTPYVAVPNAPPEKKSPNADGLMKDALGEALKKELRKSGELKSPYTRKRSSEGGSSQPSSKPPSAGSSKASSPKPTKQVTIFSESEEGPRVSSRLSETPNLSGRLSETSSRLSETPNLSRQSSAKGAYSRQSSLGSPSEEGGIRLLPRVASGTNPFLADAFGQETPSPSRRASSLPPPPTSPKKGVFEGFEQFVKVAPSTESSRRSSDVSRRSSDVTPRFDLLEDPDAAPIVVEFAPKRGANFAQQGAPWQGLDAEVAPGTWSLPEVGNEWLEVSPVHSPPGTQEPNRVSADPKVLRVAIPQQQPASPAANPFQAQYPDPFVAAFGLNPVPSPELIRTKSANPFANHALVSGGDPKPFVVAPWKIEADNKPKEALSSQKGALQRSQTQPSPNWEDFSAETQVFNPKKAVFTRSITEPPLSHSTPAPNNAPAQGNWEPFNTNSLHTKPGLSVNGSTAKADEETPVDWESFGRQRSLSSRNRPLVL